MKTMRWYYTAVFLLSFAFSDLNNIVIITLGGMNTYAIDIFYAILFIAAVKVLVKSKIRTFIMSGRLYIMFCGWLLVAMLYGIPAHGLRSLGEFRYVAFFLGFFIPFRLFRETETITVNQVSEVVLKTIFIAGIAGLFMFAIEFVNGGRFFVSQPNIEALTDFEDFRGVRYLDSYQTYNILILAFLLVIRSNFAKKVRALEILGIGVLIAAAIITKNRTSLYAITGSILIFLAYLGRIKILGFGLVLVLIVYALFATNVVRIDVDAISSGLDPAQDPTGSWRLLQLGAALDQALDTPWFGQGFGGYFYFLVPGSPPMEEPPHNQFILLFLKTGIVGLFLCVASLFAFVFQFKHVKESIKARGQYRSVFLVLSLIIFSQMIYGMAYAFIPLYGLYFGFGVLLLRVLKSENTLSNGIVAYQVATLEG